MQTTDRPPVLDGPEGPRPPGRLSTAVWIVLGVLAVPLAALMVVSRVGVALGIGLAVMAGLTLWVIRKGFAFYEIVAFLVHFDGIGMGPIRTGRVVAAVVIVYFVYKLLVERWRPPAVPTRHWIFPYLLILLVLASGIWSEVISGYLFGIATYGLAVTYFAVGAFLADGWEHVTKLLRAYWVGGLFGAAAGVLGLVLGTRSYGFGGDASFFGLLMASMIPLTVYYRREARTKREKNWYSLVLLYVFAGAAGAGSRSGVIAASVVILVTIMTRPGLSPMRRVRSSIGGFVLAAMAFLVLFVANPNNLERAFSDKGSGRIDLWNASMALVQERPILGYGASQLSEQIPDALPVTSGVEKPVERADREKVAAHNTWLEVFGDFGVVGLLIWVPMFVVTLVGFLRPRWPQAKELSRALAVMLAPIVVSSFLQPLMNMKLPWLLIGLAGALQVPSRGARWRSFLSASVAPRPTGRGDPTARPAPVGGIELAPFRSELLARWDVKVSQRFRATIALGAALGFIVTFAAMSTIPTTYVATGGIVVPQLEDAGDRKTIAVDDEQVQSIHTLVASAAYAEELRRLSGLDMSVGEVQERVSVDRPKFAAFLQLQFSDTDESNAEKAAPNMVTALDAVIARTRDAGFEMALDEFRPIYPGETSIYTGPLYLRAYQDGVIELQQPRTAFASIIGAGAGALLAAGFLLLQQTRPRVNNSDDLRSALGLPVWTHVGRAGRRYSATQDQYTQVMTVANDMTSGPSPPRTLVVASPRPDRAARGLAMGVAAAVAAEGRKVVLVDAQVDRPLLSLRLGGWFRKGLVQAMDGSVPLESTVRRVRRRRLPRSARRFLRRGDDHLRFVPAGTWRGVTTGVRPRVLDRFDQDVTVVVLAPTLLGSAPAGALIAWADAAVLALVEGRTVTFDAEDGAARLEPFVRGAAGVVLLDV